MRTVAQHRIPLLIVAFVALVAVFLISPSLAQEAAPTATKVETSSFLGWIIKVSGLIGLFIFALSIYFVAIVVQNILEVRSSVAAPPELVQACEKLIEERNPKELVTLLREDDSYFGQVLFAGVSELKYGIDEAREKLDRTADALTGKMERGISMLAVLGTLGPMIGLLGTLKGMIASFSTIAMSGVALDPGKVAEGISEALVLTFEGVALSVPAIYFYSFFRNRISMISLEATQIADDLLRATARLIKPE
jgi:biopolymer transport protein ExbB